VLKQYRSGDYCAKDQSAIGIRVITGKVGGLGSFFYWPTKDQSAADVHASAL
jgi:hypothetical protein